MTMTLTILTAIALSAVPILLLCIGDPKRRRSAEKNSNGMATSRRRILTVIACVPGIVCALTGDSAAFLMWLGGCALVGWAAAFCFLSVGRSDGQLIVTYLTQQVWRLLPHDRSRPNPEIGRALV